MGLGAALNLVLLVNAPAQAPYADHLLVEVDVPDRAALRRLLASGVDPWLEHPRPGLVPALVSPAHRAMLWADGWNLRVLSSDVQRDVDAEAERLAARPPFVPGGGEFFADFREHAAINAELDAIVLSSPELVTNFEIGESLEGRTIRAIRITVAGDDSRPAVLVTVGQHAREWIAVSSGMYVIDQLVTRAAEPEYAAILAAVQVFVVPVVNPDGYEYSWVAERYWRKNRRLGIGVDTNRNFGHNWGGPGSSDVAEEENYRGTEAFSEPETVAVRDFVAAHPELVAHLDVHSFGQLVLYPWGDVDALAPDDAALSATATVIADEMGLFGTEYTPIQGVQLYPAAGNIIDWTYGDAGLHAMTMELRPQDPEVGFILPPGQIVPVGDEVLAGLWVLLGFANGDIPEPGGNDSSTGGGDGPGESSGDGTGGDASTSTSTTTATESSTTIDPSGSASASAGTTSAGPSTDPVTDEGGTQGGSSDSGAAPASDAGCGCEIGDPRPPLWWLAAVMFAWRRRR